MHISHILFHYSFDQEGDSMRCTSPLENSADFYPGPLLQYEVQLTHIFVSVLLQRVCHASYFFARCTYSARLLMENKYNKYL